MTLTVELCGASNDLNGPISKERLVSVIEQNIHVDSQDIQKGMEEILQVLNGVSSKHKFIANVTRVESCEVDSIDLQVDNYVGTSWNAAVDGSFCHQMCVDGKVLLVSVYWISF